MIYNRRVNQMLRLPSRRELEKVVGAAFLIGVICWYFGVDVWHAILLGCAITVTALALLVGSSATDARDLSWRAGKRPRSEGSRSEIANLSSSLKGDWGFVGLTAERQLQQIARRRLALEGLDLSNAQQRSAIESRIGTQAYRVLVNRRGRVPSLLALVKCLDALDAIDPSRYPQPQQRARRWALPGIPFGLGRAHGR
jgi:hypothetical protein